MQRSLQPDPTGCLIAQRRPTQKELQGAEPELLTLMLHPPWIGSPLNPVLPPQARGPVWGCVAQARPDDSRVAEHMHLVGACALIKLKQLGPALLVAE